MRSSATRRAAVFYTRLIRLGLLATTCLATTGLVKTAAAAPSVYPTGVTRYDPTTAYNTDVLFTGADNKTYLIDMNGHVLHSWDYMGFPAKMLDPALAGGAKGVVGVQLSSVPVTKSSADIGVVPGMPALFRNKTFGFVDWSGKTLWSWGDEAPGGAALQHHDWNRLPNGHTLILCNLMHTIPGFGTRKMLDDVIYDVDAKGKTVWSWTASQHLAEFGFTPAELKLVYAAPTPDFLHVNDMEVLGPNKWDKAGDSRFAPDNIMISSRDANFTIIIDRKTGQVVWRIGPDYPARSPFRPDVVPGPINQISGQHNPHIIPEGLPGAGDVLMFDNQGQAGYPAAPLQLLGGSRVLEIDPVKKQIVWLYSGLSSGQQSFVFFSPFISSVQRLPNGNTLIDEGIDGRFFQVTPQGDIVWEYVSPFLGAAPDVPLAKKPAAANWVYRIQAVPYDWVPLAPSAQKAVAAPKLSSFRVPGG